MRRRTARRLAVALGILLVLGIAVRLALDPIATWRTRKVLAGLEGMRGTFSDVEIRLLSLSYVIHHLRIEKVGAGGKALPYLEVERAELGVYAKELLHGHLVAGVELRRPKMNLLVGKAREGTQAAKEAPEAGRGLEALAPFRIDRAEVKDGELLWVDGREPEKPRLWFHGIEATLENFATRAALARREPTVLAARATLQRSGTVSVFATADPLAKQLTFAGQGTVTGLRLAELGELLDAKTDLVPEKGTLDLYVRFRAEDGRLSGGVRPLVKDAALKAGASGLGTRLKAMLADASLHLFSDERGGKEVVATTIPIEGSVKGPQVQAVPTILGVLRNAFVRGLAGGLSGLPPPKAKEKQGTLEQARRALSPGHGPPRAQPRKGEKR